MLKILASGLFVPKEIKHSRNYYDYLKKKKYQNNSVNLHSNISNKNTDYISSNNYNNYSSNNNNSIINKRKEAIDDCLSEFVHKILKEKTQNNLNPIANLNFTFKDIYLNNKNICTKKEKYNKKEAKNQKNDNINKTICILDSNEELNLNNNSKKEIYEGLDDKLNNQNNIGRNNLKSVDLNNYQSENIINRNLRIECGKSKNLMCQSSRNFTKIIKNRNNKMMRNLSAKLKNYESYNSLINDKRLRKTKLQNSISNLENRIKIFKNNRKMKDKECVKILYDNKKIFINNERSKKKVKNFVSVQNNVRLSNSKHKIIKNETKGINERIMRIKNEIEEMNFKTKLLNLKFIDETKICDKMKKDINMYNNHSKILKAKIKKLDDNKKLFEDVINNLNEKCI